MQRIERIQQHPPSQEIKPLEVVKKRQDLSYLPLNTIDFDPISRSEILEIAPPETFENPSTSVFKVIYNFINRLESIQGTYFDMVDKEMKHTTDVVSLNLEKHIKLQDELQTALEKQGFWETLGKVAASVIGTLSIILGATLLGPGAPILAVVAGSSMILSGGISIFGTSLIDMRKNPKLAAALLITGSGIAVVGGVTGAFSGADLFKNVLSKIIIAGLSVVSNGTTIMRENYGIDLAELKANSALCQKENESLKTTGRNLELDSQNYTQTIHNLTETVIALQIHHQSAIKKIVALSGSVAG
jgi:hypothetical protein